MRRPQGAPLGPPIVPASTFHLEGDPAGAPFVYGRSGNPTWSALEEEYAATCGAASVAFASGMAACAGVVDALLPAGTVVAAPSDGYYSVRQLLTARGMKPRWVPSTDPLGFVGAADGAGLVWVETPTNPGLDVVDLQATAVACKRAGAILVVDNTLATAAGQDPFAFGADVVVVSGTKATAGHHDAVVGLASARDPATVEKLRVARTLGGAIPGVLEAWLCVRGLSTLRLRVDRMSASALAVARELRGLEGPRAHEGDSAVGHLGLPVRYPGLPSHPHHGLAARQMTAFGPVLTFDLATKERAERFCASLERIAVATSFGGVHTTLERRGRWGGDDVSPGLIRMSVGLEEPGALIEDLRRALDRSAQG